MKAANAVYSAARFKETKSFASKPKPKAKKPKKAINETRKFKKF